MRLGIVIVSYRSLDVIEALLASIARHSPSAEVVVVENSGEGKSIRDIVSRYDLDTVDLIESTSNVGYAKAVNRGAEHLRNRDCDYLLVANPDIVLTVDPAVLIPYLADVDVVAGVMTSPLEPAPSSRHVKRAMSASNVKRRVTWANSLKQAVLGSRAGRIRRVPVGELTRVPQVDGAYMLQRMSYIQANPLPEHYELYFEDVEYCQHAHSRKGVGVVGIHVAIHAGGRSASKSDGRAYVVNRVSRMRYLVRNHPGWPKCLIFAPFVLEWLTRTLTAQSEGRAARLEALKLARLEALHPASVRVLEVGSSAMTDSDDTS